MSYGFDLMRLTEGTNLDRAYSLYRRQQEEVGRGTTGALDFIDGDKELSKRRLAEKLISRFPWLKMFTKDYAGIAQQLSISEPEARRRFRNLELNGHAHSLQILLFDDEAAIKFSPSSNAEECSADLRVLWDSLRTLEIEGGFSVYDPQIGKLLHLDSDFENVRHCACGNKTFR